MTNPSASGKKSNGKLPHAPKSFPPEVNTATVTSASSAPSAHAQRGSSGEVQVKISKAAYDRVRDAVPEYERRASALAGVPVRLHVGRVLELLVREYLP